MSKWARIVLEARRRRQERSGKACCRQLGKLGRNVTFETSTTPDLVAFSTGVSLQKTGYCGRSIVSGSVALLAVDEQLAQVRAELLEREPIFHRPEFGTRAEDYLAMTSEDYWEVGASGRVYDREFVVRSLASRGKVPGDEHWVVSDPQVRRLAGDTYAITYQLVQAGRLARRLTLWRKDEDGWKALYHQGTVIEAS